MNTKRDVISVIVIITALVLFINIEASAMDFHKNLEELRDTVTIKDSQRFIKKDKDYLKDSPNIFKIKLEIKELKEEVKKLEDEYEIINNIKIYKGSIGLKNNALRTAIKNRELYMEDKKSFEYDERIICDLMTDYIESPDMKIHFTEEEMDMIYESIVDVVRNIELDTDFLKDTKFLVSPFVLEGANGYTVLRSDDQNLIIISNNILGAPEEWFRKSVKSTVLHEIGHIFQNSKEEQLEENIKREYLLQIEEKLKEESDDLGKWESSVEENFAEDFRMYYSTRLGNSSFEPLSKKASVDYDEREFKKIIYGIK